MCKTIRQRNVQDLHLCIRRMWNNKLQTVASADNKQFSL